MAFELVILGSGKGSNARNLIQSFKDSEAIRISTLITDRSSSAFEEIAAEHNIDFILLDRSALGAGELLAYLQSANPDLILLAGFLQKIPLNVVQHYNEKIINVHPSLLPAHGGKGMYGRHVHESVLSGGDTESGVTFHFVNEEFDQGRIIAQYSLNVLDNESVESLSHRVMELEHKYYPEVVRKILAHELG